MFPRVVIFYLILNSSSNFGLERACSRFDYEEKVLEKMIRQEIAMEKMRSEMDDIKNEVTNALTDLKNERNTNAEDLEKRVSDIETVKMNMEKALADMKAKNDKNLEAYSAELDQIKGSATPTSITFKAQNVSDKGLANNKVIIFGESSLNIGNAYNNQTGNFVAAAEGIYLFTAQICTNGNEWSYFGIFLNEKPISTKLHGNKDWIHCSSINAVAVVGVGEQVSVKCVGSCDSDHLWEREGYAECSFMGTLLHMS